MQINYTCMHEKTIIEISTIMGKIYNNSYINDSNRLSKIILVFITIIYVSCYFR